MTRLDSQKRSFTVESYSFNLRSAISSCADFVIPQPQNLHTFEFAFPLLSIAPLFTKNAYEPSYRGTRHHTSKVVRQQWPRWQEQGLFIFLLPAYCSEINPIEGQWHQLKAHEISGRMFDNEYDLALAVMEGMESHSEQGEYALERFKFKSS